MAGTFIITELPVRGRGVVFRWDATHRSSPPVPWTFGTMVRTKRTDYPGGDDVTEQVFGPSSKPFTLRGRWDDRYNSAGFAMKMLRAFDAMVRRGSRVRFEFRGISFEGLINDAEYDYVKDSLIAYSFMVSPHVAGLNAPLRSPTVVDKPLSAQNLIDTPKARLDAARAAHAQAPAEALSGTLLADVNRGLDVVDKAIADIDAAVQERTAVVTNAARTVLRMSQQLSIVRGETVGMLDGLVQARSDVSLAYQTAVAVLDFDSWVRELAFQLRLLLFGTETTRLELARRAEPSARALYRPRVGESLYSVSRKFYGTPHAWRTIASRNGLTYTDLTGEELLVIPEAA